MAIMAKAMPLRRVVIKEELVALTGDFMEALILNQPLYWSQRARDYAQLMAEEIERTQGGMDSAADWRPPHGWIYKKSAGFSSYASERVHGNLLQVLAVDMPK